MSALVHSSTLVTAGVFLLIRFYPILSTSKIFFFILIILSSLTILIRGLGACIETDLKKIIALSTLRQLGLIIITLAIGYPNLALFHLLTHAIFKALLFLCTGSLIHFHSHAQDARAFGDIGRQLPITATRIIIASLVIRGTPFLAAYYSKDLILETAVFYPIAKIIIIILFFATALTSFYS